LRLGLKVAAAFLVLAVVAWMGWQRLLQSAFVEGETWIEPVGGNWSIQYHQTPSSHSGPDAKLLRKKEASVTVVDDLASNVRYLGDDCIAYASARDTLGPQYLAACGDRRSVILVPPNYEQWRLTDAGLVKLAPPPDNSVLATIPVAEIRKRALVMREK
jgi:hypothetical protein